MLLHEQNEQYNNEDFETLPIRESDNWKELDVSTQAISVNCLEQLDTETLTKSLFDVSLTDADVKALCRMSAIEVSRRYGVDLETANKIAMTHHYARVVATSHSDRKKVSSPADIADLLMPFMRDLQQEICVTLLLDTKGGITETIQVGSKDVELMPMCEVISQKVIYTGTLNASMFHPREILKAAIDARANSFIVSHNHPSGDPQPSNEDTRATKQLIEAGQLVGIKLLDHIIIGDGIFCSLREEGLI